MARALKPSALVAAPAAPDVGDAVCLAVGRHTTDESLWSVRPDFYTGRADRVSDGLWPEIFGTDVGLRDSSDQWLEVDPVSPLLDGQVNEGLGATHTWNRANLGP